MSVGRGSRHLNVPSGGPACDRRSRYTRTECQDTFKNHGPPDMYFVTTGVKQFAHSKLLCSESQTIGNLLKVDSSRFISEIMITQTDARKESFDSITALLDALYLPHSVPSPELLPQVCDIARELNMYMLLNRLKLWVAGEFNVSYLLAAEGYIAAIPDAKMRAESFPHVIFDAFAEFAVDELQATLPGYGELRAETRLEISRRRVALLEDFSARSLKMTSLSPSSGSRNDADKSKEVSRIVGEYFRRCPEELLVSYPERTLRSCASWGSCWGSASDYSDRDDPLTAVDKRIPRHVGGSLQDCRSLHEVPALGVNAHLWMAPEARHTCASTGSLPPGSASSSPSKSTHKTHIWSRSEARQKVREASERYRTPASSPASAASSTAGRSARQGDARSEGGSPTSPCNPWHGHQRWDHLTPKAISEARKRGVDPLDFFPGGVRTIRRASGDTSPVAGSSEMFPGDDRTMRHASGDASPPADWPLTPASPKISQMGRPRRTNSRAPHREEV